MIKKLSVFPTSALRRDLQQDRELRNNKALKLALAFPGQLVAELMEGLQHRGLGSPAFPNIDGKMFAPACAPSGWLDSVFSKTSRIEATIHQYTKGSFTVVVVFFPVGRKAQFLAEVEVIFGPTDRARAPSMRLANAAAAD